MVVLYHVNIIRRVRLMTHCSTNKWLNRVGFFVAFCIIVFVVLS
jgi:hypothetical protein